MTRHTTIARNTRAPHLAALCAAALLGPALPATAQTSADQPPASLRLIDVTGDGLLDRLELTADGELHVSVNLGGRVFDAIAQELPSTPVADILVGDLDDDGLTDLYLVSPAENLALTGDGTGRFTDATARLGLADGGAGVRAQRLDLDGDGFADLLLRNASRDVVFWKTPGLGFERSADTPAEPVDGGALSQPGAAGGSACGRGTGGAAGGGAGGSHDGPGAGADGGATPSGLPPGVEPLVPSGQGASIGSGGSLGGAPRVGGTRGHKGNDGIAPTPVLPPTLAAILDDKYVNDDAGEVDGADIIDGVLTGADVSTVSGDVTHLGGRLGVGTATPSTPFHVLGDTTFELPPEGRIEVSTAAGRPTIRGVIDTGAFTDMLFGNFGLVIEPPQSSRSLTLRRVGSSGAGSSEVWFDRRDAGNQHQGFVGYQEGRGLYLRANGTDRLNIDPDGGSVFTGDVVVPSLSITGNGGTTVPALTVAGMARVDVLEIMGNGGTTLPALTVAGMARVDVLEIMGGSDIVEGFDSAEEQEPGTVVVLDPERPGEVVASRAGYDRRVAGVVSGAGGVRPGMRLTQDGVLGGDVPVAMTGRVYVKCSAENGAIRPGDRLTTAALAGHAMRVSDETRAPGAVLGKAMSSLDEGTGLVLVLVNLQ